MKIILFENFILLLHYNHTKLLSENFMIINTLIRVAYLNIF